MNVKEMVIAKLREIGADGLYNENGECGCGLDDLAPCYEGIVQECEAAKRIGDLFYPMEDA
jgi:hypothetical protein